MTIMVNTEHEDYSLSHDFKEADVYIWILIYKQIKKALKACKPCVSCCATLVLICLLLESVHFPLLELLNVCKFSILNALKLLQSKQISIFCIYKPQQATFYKLSLFRK